MENQQTSLESWSETVSGELYDDLLNRYERVLVYAGQLQEKGRQQKLLSQKNDGLRQENARLQKLLGVEESYSRLLEKALVSLGVLRPGSGGRESISPAAPPGGE